MKRTIFTWSALVVLCASSAAFADDRPRVFQTAEINPGGPGIAAEGAAWLKRSKNRVDGRVMAKVDKANKPYTIWWVIFNNPAACAEETCGPGDLFNPAVDAAIFNASGAISAVSGDGGGVINVDISVIGREGAGNGSQMGPAPLPFFMNDLNKNNGLCAEIHVDINEHDVDGDIDWVRELTYPMGPQAFAIFPAVGKCSGK